MGIQTSSVRCPRACDSPLLKRHAAACESLAAPPWYCWQCCGSPTFQSTGTIPLGAEWRFCWYVKASFDLVSTVHASGRMMYNSNNTTSRMSPLEHFRHCSRIQATFCLCIRAIQLQRGMLSFWKNLSEDHSERMRHASLHLYHDTPVASRNVP